MDFIRPRRYGRGGCIGVHSRRLLNGSLTWTHAQAAHAIIHVVVTSNSGQAVLTMPIMAPTADLLGISRDAAVMAYQAGAPPMDVIIPTNGALFAMLYKAGVPYGRWLRFAIPGVLLLMLVGVVGVIVLR